MRIKGALRFDEHALQGTVDDEALDLVGRVMNPIRNVDSGKADDTAGMHLLQRHEMGIVDLATGQRQISRDDGRTVAPQRDRDVHLRGIHLGDEAGNGSVQESGRNAARAHASPQTLDQVALEVGVELGRWRTATEIDDPRTRLL